MINIHAGIVFHKNKLIQKSTKMNNYSKSLSVIKLVGKGTFGKVFLALHMPSMQLVVVGIFILQININ